MVETDGLGRQHREGAPARWVLVASLAIKDLCGLAAARRADTSTVVKKALAKPLPGFQDIPPIRTGGLTIRATAVLDDDERRANRCREGIDTA
jgi:hypothetical protein